MNLSEKIKEARKIAQAPRIAKGEGWYSRCFVRNFTIYLSYLFWKLGIPANVVTVAMGAVGLAGSACMVFDNLWLTITGAFLWQLWYALDCVDGELARLHGRPSLFGIYLDELTHIFVNPTFILALGVYVCLKEWSLVNAAVTIVVYLAYGWVRQIRRVTNTHLIVKGGKEAQKIEFNKFDNKSIRSWFNFAVVQSFGEIGHIFIIPTVIILNRAIRWDIVSWFLYLYTILFLAYMVTLILRDGYRIYKIGFQKLPD